MRWDVIYLFGSFHKLYWLFACLQVAPKIIELMNKAHVWTCITCSKKSSFLCILCFTNQNLYPAWGCWACRCSSTEGLRSSWTSWRKCFPWEKGFLVFLYQHFGSSLLQFPFINNSGQEDEATIWRCTLVAICLHEFLVFVCFSSVYMFLFCLHVFMFACFSFVGMFSCLHVCCIYLNESLCSHLRPCKLRWKWRGERRVGRSRRSKISASFTAPTQKLRQLENIRRMKIV